MQVIKNSLIYLGSSILNKLVPFLLLPIMTKYLSPKEYGILALYTILITFYNAFIGMSIHTNISKNFFKVSKGEMSEYIGNMIFIIFLTFIIYLSITFLVIQFFDNLFSIPSYWILAIPIISFMMTVNSINTTLLRNEGRAYIFGIFEIVNTLINISITLLLLVNLEYGWKSQIVGLFIGYFIFFIIGLLYMKKRNYLKFTFDKTKVKSILSISIPLIPHVLGGIVIGMSDRIFIEKMVSLEAVGIYSVGYMFGMIIVLFSDAFIKAWSPWFFKNLSNPTDTKKQKIVKYTYIYIFGIFIFAVLISFIGKWILPYFVDERYIDARNYILWISIGYAVHSIYKIFFPYLVHINKTAFLAISTVVAAILNLILNYYFINIFGVVGAAYATIISFLVGSILVFWYQSIHYSMPWKGSK
jgi:O-antigen/teichoic acid export membrane protein